MVRTKATVIKALIREYLSAIDYNIWKNDIIAKEIFDVFFRKFIRKVDYNKYHVYLISVNDEEFGKIYREMVSLSKKTDIMHTYHLANYVIYNLKNDLEEFSKKADIETDIIFTDNTFYLELKFTDLYLRKEDMIENLTDIIINENLYKKVTTKPHKFFEDENNPYILKAIKQTINPIPYLFDFHRNLIFKILELSNQYFDFCKKYYK